MTRIDAPERVPDWLLGGRVRRRVITALTSKEGCNVADLAEEINAGDATVYEVLRALRGMGALEKVARGRWRLARDQPVARALRALVAAGHEHSDWRVSRPPGRVKRQ
jgi:predicted transcriptional regulator